jgi:predicted nuclease of predicted toxin-antitoxin system
MTFLFDHDTPDDVAYSLETLGHHVVRLREVLPVDSSDAAILAQAQAQGWVVITCNRDDFLALGEIQPHAGIIVLVRRKTRVAERAALVRLLDAAGESGVRNNINFA